MLEMIKEYHRNAYNFYQSLTDKDKGKWAVCKGFAFYNGRLLPDYRNCKIVNNYREAEKHANNLRRLFGQCYIVVQV